MSEQEFKDELQKLGWEAGRMTPGVYRFHSLDNKRSIAFTNPLSLDTLTYEAQLDRLKEQLSRP